jgi:Skp family chaperone for outer membrane proteins
MASRRRKRDEESGSLDSLMDALTNVVAVLILILILLQADVRQAVEKIVESLKPVSVEQLQQARVKQQEMEKAIAAREKQKQAPAPTPEEIAKIKADLALLEKAAERDEKLLIELKKLQQTAEQTEQKANAEKAKTDDVLVEIARLEALLDQTPRPAVKRPTVVRLPNSREIPKNATIYYCYITGDQAHLVDPVAVKETLMEAFEREARNLVRERVKVKGARDRVIYDQEKTVAFFASKNWNVRNQKVSVPFNRPWTRLNFRIDLDPAKGDASLEDMNQPDGRFHKMMKLVRSYRNGVLMFRVRPDGFETYLKAREIADEMRMPCGWEIDGNNAYAEPLDFEVNRLEQPRPGPPPPKDKPVPKPKRVLD